MNRIITRRRFAQQVAVASAAALGACGGGGDDGDATSLPPPSPVTSDPPFEIAGFNINMYGRDRLLRAANYTASLDRLVATGANTVMVTTPYFQSSATSSSLGADSTDTERDENLVTLIRALKARGMQVAYKFTLIPRDGSWSGAIAPADTTAWFASYRANLVRLASLAQSEGVDLFYVANEMQSMAGRQYEAQWNAMIDAVQTVYSGRLSWNAVLNARGFPDGEAFNIPVALRLNHIGLSAYEPLTGLANPSVAQLRQAWYGNRLGHDLVTMVKELNRRTGRPVVFSELCYRSVDGNNRDPGDWMAKPSDVQDPQEQADCYEAFMRVWTTEAQPWMLGVLWWQWMIEPQADRFVSHDQTPQGNAAERLIAGWFTGAIR